VALLNKSFGFGSRELAAPQAGLMATLAAGVVGGDMAWPLVVVGAFMGIAMIMMQVRSPMLVAVGMYCPSRPPSQFSWAESFALWEIGWPSAAVSIPHKWRASRTPACSPLPA
jgi:hypothetical protein